MINLLKNRNVFLTLSALVILLTIILLYKLFFSTNKIAYIDAGRIYNEYKGIKLAKVEFEKKAELFKSRVDTLSGKIKLDIMKIDQNRGDKIRHQQFVDSVRFHKKQLFDYQSAMEQSLKQEESKLTQKAMIKLNEFIKEYGNDHGYDMILIASPSGTIAFAKEKFDITEKILAEANEKL